jgi:3-hydroxymyristoyl/3-hydroxydecanoyl-(acyl carrier protein) dehydratase
MSVTDPIVVHERVDAHSAEIAIVVPHDLSFIEGHFPGMPVVPGVVQLKWVLDLARRRLGVRAPFAGCENLKFQKLLRPGDRATLTLEHVEATGKLAFSFDSPNGRYSSGRALLTAARNSR